MIFAESSISRASAEESQQQQQQSESVSIVDSSTIINTANALLAISAAFSAQQTEQINQIPSIIKLQNAITENMKNVSQKQALARNIGLSDSLSFEKRPQQISIENGTDDIIYKNSPLRHYHSHYRASFSSSQAPVASKQADEQENDDNTTSGASSLSPSAR